MANSTQHQKTDSDGMIMLGFSLASIALFAVIFWIRFHGNISALLIFERNILNYPFYLLYALIVKATGTDLPLMRDLLYSTTSLCHPSSLTNPFTTCTRDASQISFAEIMKGSLLWNMVFGAIAIGISIKSYLKLEKEHPVKKFGKTHTLDSFMLEQQQNEPHLKLVTDFNLQLINQNEGPFMGMKTTKEFAKEHKLVSKQTDREILFMNNGVTQSQKDSQEKVPVIDRKKLVNILRGQLGGLWVGVDHLTPAQTILLAMYLPRACSTDREMLDEEFNEIFKKCQKLEEEFWLIATDDILYSEKFAPIGHYSDKTPKYPDGKKDLSVFQIQRLKDEFIKPYMDHKVTLDMLEKHAYTHTFIVAVVYCARRLGVMAPCQMRWLRFYDRETWALLQNIGRPSFFCENMGSISHYQAEVVAKEKIYQPHFDVAIRGFEFQLKSYLYSPEALINLGLDPTKINEE